MNLSYNPFDIIMWFMIFYFILDNPLKGFMPKNSKDG